MMRSYRLSLRLFEIHVLIFIRFYDIRQVLRIFARLCHYLSSDYMFKQQRFIRFEMNEVTIACPF